MPFRIVRVPALRVSTWRSYPVSALSQSLNSPSRIDYRIFSTSIEFPTSMPPNHKYTDPKLRDEVKAEVQQGDKGGAPGQWSARKVYLPTYLPFVEF